ncbi:MAG: endo-1,4-beta-xylanase [Ignavibacteria bacterium]|nr:endo-1,4-beta-xylanase [Ignavibacteria bacterium]
MASGKSKFVGNIIANGYSIRSDFSKYWNQVTPENATKWASVEGTAGNYNWGQVDNIYNYALTNKIPFKHHTLVWGQQYPGFVATLDSAALYARIEAWIKICGEKYPKTAMVDVVNEPLHAFTGTALNLIKALGGTGTTGWDWVVKAFELTRKYWSSSTKLILNDYNIINSSTATANLITIVNVLKSKGFIDGIGIQAHGFEIDGPAVTTLKSNLDKLAATGIPIYITEFDISSANDETQLQKYRTIFPILYEHPGVAGITLWGYVYAQTWRADAHLLTDRNAERPSLQWLRSYLQSPFRPITISPIGTSNEARNPLIKWRSSQTSTSYHLQISNNRLLTTTVVDTIIADTVFQSKTLEANTTFYWRVSAKNDKAEGEYSDIVSFITGSNIVSVEEELVPTKFELHQNYPNPFNPETTISYTIPSTVKSETINVTLKVFDVLGREVAVLVDEYKQPGNYKVKFNVETRHGASLQSGVYFYTFKTTGFTQTKKMLLLK